MNGRAYDPLVGRFISGDSLVQDSANGQNYNRYSYVLNNPTNLTDPTGFNWLSECTPGRKEISTFAQGIPYLGEIQKLKKRY
ncbi:RHS repeat-associated core domain-containing protein [Undibacterium sp. MH2W]|uniref:RHS repeat-associated core domain-containing protein n=1 Tax=Undibacterium sp. MH2W TaxID=3413044 RepID=UPI003BF315A3